MSGSRRARKDSRNNEKFHRISKHLYIGRNNNTQGRQNESVEAIDVVENKFDVVIQMGKLAADSMLTKITNLFVETTNADDFKIQSVEMGSPFQEVKRDKSYKEGTLESVSYEAVGKHERPVTDFFIKYSYGDKDLGAIYYYHISTLEELSARAEILYKLWLFSHQLKVCILYENPIIDEIDEDPAVMDNRFACANLALAVVSFFKVFSHIVKGSDFAHMKKSLASLADNETLDSRIGHYLAGTKWYVGMVKSSENYSSELARKQNTYILRDSLLPSFTQRFINDKGLQKFVHVEFDVIKNFEINDYKKTNADEEDKQIKLHLLEIIHQAFMKLKTADNHVSVIGLAMLAEMMLSHPASWADTDKILGKKIPSKKEGGVFIRMLKSLLTLCMRDLQVSKEQVNELVKLLTPAISRFVVNGKITERKPSSSLLRTSNLFRSSASSSSTGVASPIPAAGNSRNGTPYGSMPPQPPPVDDHEQSDSQSPRRSQ